jgi:amino acid adenylation domain-containing protein
VTGVPDKMAATAAQMRFYLLDQRDGGNARTLVRHVIAHGTLDPGRLTEALRAVLAAHPALRTSLHLGPDGLRQRVHPVGDVPLEVREAGPEHVTDVVRRPFTHGAGPLCAISAFVGPRRTDLVVTVHHAVFDEPSMAVLLRHLAAAYAHGPAGLPSVADPWRADSRAVARAREYWAAEVADLAGDTALPQAAAGAGAGAGAGGGAGGGVGASAGANAGANAGAGAARRASVRATLAAARLRQTALACGASPFMQVVAALGIVLGWYGDTDDVVVAVVVDGRGPHDTDVIGCVQNTVPVRLRLAGTNTAEVLDLAMDAVLNAIDHAALPIEEIVDLASAGGPRRVLTHVLCTEARTPAPVEVGGLRWELVAGPPPETTEFDLEIAMVQRRDAAELDVAYRADKVAGSLAHRFAGSLVRALDLFGAAEPVPLADLDLLDEDERALLTALGRGPRLPASRLVTDLIAEQADRRPEAPAVRDAAGAVSYGELATASASLARALTEAGVRPGDRVGIALPRTADLVIAVLGVLRAGAAFVPLPPDHPEERLRYMAADSGMRAVVGASPPGALPSGVPALPVRPDPAPRGGELPAIGADLPAYVIYTSGSTGRPKGVAVRHGNLAALLAGFDRLIPRLPDVVVAATALSFDISLLEQLWPLAHGRTVLVTDHRRVAGDVRDRGALYQCTPTVAGILARDSAGRAFLGRLGVLLVGGEPLPQDLADELAVLVPGPVWNCYGPTETTVWSTAWRVKAGDPVHIGHPLAGERWYVVDSLDRRLPLGTPGRLFLAGTGVAAGYWRRPELTARRFRPLAGAERAYDTGDVVVVDPEHGLRFVDRADTQVKVLGQRIELGEIEAVLRDHPQVRAAVVTPAFDRTALVAHVEAAGPVADLDAHARRLLPPSMVPVAFHVVDELPRTSHDKLDRRRVARWAAELRPPRAIRSAGTIDLVLRLWSQVLGRPVTEVDTTFFDLGGSSVQLLQVVVALRERDPDVTAADLFRSATARKLADHLDRDGGHRPAGPPGRGVARARAIAGWRNRYEARRRDGD